MTTPTPDAPSTILTLDAILAASDLEERVVDVPEWGGSVRIRSLTKLQQQLARRQATVRFSGPTGPREVIDNDKLEGALLQAALVEPALRTEDVERLRAKAAAPIDRILRAVLDLSGLGAQAVADAAQSFQDQPGTAV
jgi:hypothetical protein